MVFSSLRKYLGKCQIVFPRTQVLNRPANNRVEPQSLAQRQ